MERILYKRLLAWKESFIALYPFEKYRFFVFKKYSLASSVKCLRPFFNDFIYKKVLDKVGAKLYNILNPVPQKYQVRVKIIKKN